MKKWISIDFNVNTYDNRGITMKKPNKTPTWNRIRVNEGKIKFKTEFRTANG